jgi:hypothetical protein
LLAYHRANLSGLTAGRKTLKFVSRCQTPWGRAAHNHSSEKNFLLGIAGILV